MKSNDSVLRFLAGPNGSGKSAALRATAYPGHPLSDPIRKKLFPDLPGGAAAFLPQGPQKPIFSRDVQSLLVTPLVYAGHSVETALRRVKTLLNRFSFDYLVNRDYFTLSGGEQQFVGLFSVLFRGTPLVLLDDPTTMLDKERAVQALGVIGKYGDETPHSDLILSGTTPELSGSLPHDEVIHLGYCPDSVLVVDQLDRLLSSLSVASNTSSSLLLRALRIAPYGRELLKETSIELSSGYIYLLGGPNGEGKTCFLKTLGGLLPPASGSVVLAESGGESTPRPGRSAFFFPQHSPGLLSFGTVQEELLGNGDPVWWEELLTFAYDWGILDPKTTACEGSFGELRFRGILAFLGAIARTPSASLVLIDEPDASLDPLRIAFLSRVLSWLCTRRVLTLLIATHRPEVFSVPSESHVCKHLLLTTSTLRELDESSH